LIVAGVVGGVFALTVLFYSVSVSNREARLRNQIKAKQVDNNSEFDNLWKKISQVAQVTDAQKHALLDIIVGNAKARAGQGGGSLATAVHEAVPNVDTKTFENLQNIIAGSRDSWTFRQKELLDVKREHDNMLSTFPSSLVLGLLGREPIDVTIVTSGRTKEAFRTGEDNDVEIFDNRK
jgi:hypothetical protein